jgi:DedD protein
MPDTREPQLDELRRRARRRLVGAVVLALAAAVIVPMLLESEPKPLGEDVSVKIPPIDDGKFVSKVGEKATPVQPAAKAEPAPEPKAGTAGDTAPPAAATPPAAAEPPAEPPKEPARPAPDAARAGSDAGRALASAEQKVLSPTAKPLPVKPAEPPKAEARSEPKEPAKEAPKEAAKAPEPAKTAEAPKAGGYSVQLAAFIDDKGANSLAGKLKKSGYPAYTEPYQTSRGTLWRVRVGPYGTRDAAEAARAKLKGEGQNGLIAAAK